MCFCGVLEHASSKEAKLYQQTQFHYTHAHTEVYDVHAGFYSFTGSMSHDHDSTNVHVHVYLH